MTILAGSGTGSFTPAGACFLDATATGQTLITSDLNADGKDDLAAATYGGATAMSQG